MRLIPLPIYGNRDDGLRRFSASVVFHTVVGVAPNYHCDRALRHGRAGEAAQTVSPRITAAHDFHDRIEAVFREASKNTYGISGLRANSSSTRGAIYNQLLIAFF